MSIARKKPTTPGLTMEFRGEVTERRAFLLLIRSAVTGLTGEQMTLDALINEIAKNIFDHANGLGSLMINRIGDSFIFEIKDKGEEKHDFGKLVGKSRLAGNGVNFGTGLMEIKTLAETLGIDLRIDTSKGFTYSGVYILRSAG